MRLRQLKVKVHKGARWQAGRQAGTEEKQAVKTCKERLCNLLATGGAHKD